MGVTPGNFALLTLHRPSNVDDRGRLASILQAVHKISQRLPVVFVMHPRTRNRLELFDFDSRPDLNGYVASRPLGYHQLLGLMDQARFVLTDSGGIQEETTALGVPCLTLRETTERPLRVLLAANVLNAALYCVMRYLPVVEAATGQVGWGRELLMLLGMFSMLLSAAFIVFQHDT